jgi:hypothetical protein
MSAALPPSVLTSAGRAVYWLAPAVWAMMAPAYAPMLRFYRTGWLWKGRVSWRSRR